MTTQKNYIKGLGTLLGSVALLLAQGCASGAAVELEKGIEPLHAVSVVIPPLSLEGLPCELSPLIAHQITAFKLPLVGVNDAPFPVEALETLPGNEALQLFPADEALEPLPEDEIPISTAPAGAVSSAELLEQPVQHAPPLN